MTDLFTVMTGLRKFEETDVLVVLSRSGFIDLKAIASASFINPEYGNTCHKLYTDLMFYLLDDRLVLKEDRAEVLRSKGYPVELIPQSTDVAAALITNDARYAVSTKNGKIVV